MSQNLPVNHFLTTIIFAIPFLCWVTMALGHFLWLSMPFIFLIAFGYFNIVFQPSRSFHTNTVIVFLGSCWSDGAHFSHLHTGLQLHLTCLRISGLSHELGRMSYETPMPFGSTLRDAWNIWEHISCLLMDLVYASASHQHPTFLSEVKYRV